MSAYPGLQGGERRINESGSLPLVEIIVNAEAGGARRFPDGRAGYGIEKYRGEISGFLAKELSMLADMCALALTELLGAPVMDSAGQTCGLSLIQSDAADE